MSDEATVCPWCQTEIVWDEEVGPEAYCPHCDNELTGYRTISLGVDRDDADGEADEDEEDYEDDDEAERAGAAGSEGFRRTDARLLALQDKVDRVVDGQEEAPECPSCREYMIEAGSQQAGGGGYEPAVPESLGRPLLPGPFRIVWFVCPACFTVQQRLSAEDRGLMLKRLASGH